MHRTFPQIPARSRTWYTRIASSTPPLWLPCATHLRVSSLVARGCGRSDSAGYCPALRTSSQPRSACQPRSSRSRCPSSCHGLCGCSALLPQRMTKRNSLSCCNTRQVVLQSLLFCRGDSMALSFNSNSKSLKCMAELVRVGPFLPSFLTSTPLFKSAHEAAGRERHLVRYASLRLWMCSCGLQEAF